MNQDWIDLITEVCGNRRRYNVLDMYRLLEKYEEHRRDSRSMVERNLHIRRLMTYRP